MRKTSIKRKTSKNKPAVLDFKLSDLFSPNYQIITLVLIFFPWLIYWQVYNFEFVWDDYDSGTIGHLKHPFVLAPSWESFKQLFVLPFFGMYIPLSYLFWGLLKLLAELLSLPVDSILHLSNVVVHTVNGLLAFVILRQFVANKWAVLVGTLFFLLHPIQAEVVAWVSEFRSLLATCFTLTALYLYLKQKTKLFYLSLGLFILAILAKPSALALVPFVFFINHFHYGFKLAKNSKKTLPFVLIGLVFIIIAQLIQSQYHTNIAQYGLDFWQRPVAWLDSMVFYLYKIIFPYHLGASYALSPKFISTQWWFYPLALLPLALGWLLWLKRKKQPLLIFASMLFIAGFFTTSGWVHFGFQKYSLVADRYMYFAMIGVGLLVATLFNKTDNKYWQGFIVGVLVIFTALPAFRQIPIWKNPHALWSHSAKYEITNSYANDNFAVGLN